jgi:glycine hydroxymethyltransferase
MKPSFTVYAKQVRSNCRTLAAALIGHGFSLATDGTDNHLVLWNLRPQGVTGSKMQKVCDAVGITLNKNSIFGDKSAMTPGGVRIGTPAMTTRGLKDADFTTIANLLKRCCDIAVECQATAGTKKLKDFVVALDAHAAVVPLRDEVCALATSFPMPGFDVSTMKYNDPATVAAIVHGAH